MENTLKQEMLRALRSALNVLNNDYPVGAEGLDLPAYRAQVQARVEKAIAKAEED